MHGRRQGRGEASTAGWGPPAGPAPLATAAHGQGWHAAAAGKDGINNLHALRAIRKGEVRGAAGGVQAVQAVNALQQAGRLAAPHALQGV